MYNIIYTASVEYIGLVAVIVQKINGFLCFSLFWDWRLDFWTTTTGV
jgi:hypothetical protein